MSASPVQPIRFTHADLEKRVFNRISGEIEFCATHFATASPAKYANLRDRVVLFPWSKGSRDAKKLLEMLERIKPKAP